MATTYLSRTPSSTTNRKTFTISAWVKRANISVSDKAIFSGGSDANVSGFYTIKFDDNDKLRVQYYDDATYNIRTNRVFRDVAWYHIMVANDTTQGTASNRTKIYINGVQETDVVNASGSTADYPNTNFDYNVNNDSVQQVGANRNSSASVVNYFDGEMAHFHLTDGTAYDASAFGETDATTGIWKPKTAPSVTYGTNGFFLKFENSGAFGTDSSGNSNNFTVNGTMTQTIDTPSNVFNVLNAVSNPPNGYTLSNGNLEATVSGQSFVRQFIANTIAPTSGKWYWESKLITSGGTDRSSIGICSYDENIGTGTTIPQNELSICTGFSRIRFTENGSTTEVDSFYTVPSANDIFMYALDLDNTKFYFGVNGNWWNYNSSETGGDPTSGSGYVTNSTNIIKSAMSAFLRVQAGAVSTTFTNQFNFGNGYFGTTAVSSAQNPDDGIGIFEYDVPTGYRALCTKSINAEEYS